MRPKSPLLSLLQDEHAGIGPSPTGLLETSFLLILLFLFIIFKLHLEATFESHLWESSHEPCPAQPSLLSQGSSLVKGTLSSDGHTNVEFTGSMKNRNVASMCAHRRINVCARVCFCVCVCRLGGQGSSLLSCIHSPFGVAHGVGSVSPWSSLLSATPHPLLSPLCRRRAWPQAPALARWPLELHCFPPSRRLSWMKLFAK